jgi:hypothetical protein
MDISIEASIKHLPILWKVSRTSLYLRTMCRLLWSNGPIASRSDATQWGRQVCPASGHECAKCNHALLSLIHSFGLTSRRQTCERNDCSWSKLRFTRDLWSLTWRTPYLLSCNSAQYQESTGLIEMHWGGQDFLDPLYFTVINAHSPYGVTCACSNDKYNHSSLPWESSLVSGSESIVLPTPVWDSDSISNTL